MEETVHVGELRQGVLSDAESDNGWEVVILVAAFESLADESADVEDAPFGEECLFGALYLNEGLEVVVNGGEDVEDDALNRTTRP